VVKGRTSRVVSIRMQDDLYDQMRKVVERQKDTNVNELINQLITSYVNAAQNDDPKPNDKCPCGSGKKYRKCCGNKK